MREASTGLLVELDPGSNVTDLLLEQHAKDPVHALYSRKGPAGWADVSAQQFLDQVRALAKGLIAGGLTPGETVAVMSGTRYEWTVVDFAIWFAGGVTVPIYETSSASQIEWILHDSGARRDLRRRRGQGGPGPRGPGQLRPARRLCAARGADGLRRRRPQPRQPGRRGHRRRRRRAGTAPVRGRPRGRRLPRLHLRHHRPAQGLRNHARQLRPGGQEHRAVPAGDPAAAPHPDPDVPAAGPRPGPRRPGDLPQRRDHRGPHRQRQGAAGGPGQLQAHLPAGGAPDLREGLRRRRPQGRPGREGAPVRVGRRSRHRLLQGARRRRPGHRHRPRAGGSAPGTPSSTGCCTPSCARPSAASWATRSPGPAR